MAPRGRFLDLERHDALFFYGSVSAYHRQTDGVSVATYGIVLWPVFLMAALVLHLVIAPFPHAAAVCGALYVAYCFVLENLDRAAPAQAQASTSSSPWPSTAGAVPQAEPPLPATRRMVAASGYMIEQKSK